MSRVAKVYKRLRELGVEGVGESFVCTKDWAAWTPDLADARGWACPHGCQGPPGSRVTSLDPADAKLVAHFFPETIARGGTP